MIENYHLELKQTKTFNKFLIFLISYIKLFQLLWKELIIMIMNLELTSLDILYLSLSIGFLVLVIFFVFLILKLGKTLDAVRILAQDLDDTARDVNGIKNQIKGQFYGMASSLLGLFMGKGR